MGSLVMLAVVMVETTATPQGGAQFVAGVEQPRGHPGLIVVDVGHGG
jgi:hypothetical protein